MNHLGFFLCLKYLRSKKIVLLSVAAVAMSCALLITVASLFTGFIEAFENGASDNLGNIIITPPLSAGARQGYKISDVDDLIATLQADADISAATAVLSGQGLLFLGQGNVRAVQVWGIELPQRAKVVPFDRYLVRQKGAGEKAGFGLEDIAPEEGGLVGIGVVARADDKTDKYDMEAVRKDFIGRKVMLTTGAVVSDDGENSESDLGGDSRLSNFKRKRIRFTITDVVFSGLYDFDKNYIYLPLETYCEQIYPGRGKLADAIHIRLADGVDIEAGKEKVEEIWAKWSEDRIVWGSFAEVNTSRHLQARLAAEYQKQMQMLMVIFGLVSGGVILLVFCIFYLIVATKLKDIAIIKSCGTGWASVAMLYVVFGLMIGIAGSALGIGIGYVVTANINVIEQWISNAFGLKLWQSSTYMFSRIPNEVDWMSVVKVSIAAVIAATMGALIPAFAAAKVQPVRILRYE